MSEHLDELLLSYMDTIDTYQSLRISLGSRFSAGFLALAQANFRSPSRRYGQDAYDERMTAMRGVKIIEQESGAVFESTEIDVDQEQSEDDKQKKAEGTEDDNKGPYSVKPRHRDPIRWYGILVPPALRTVQSEFTSAMETTIPQLLTALSKISYLESQIYQARTKYLYKILIAAPPSPLPQALPLSPFDSSSGFIHMCTAAQVAGVIIRFMGTAERVWLLKIPYGKIEANLRWEGATGSGEGGEKFPHFFSKKLGIDEVEDNMEFERGIGGVWEGVFDAIDWLEG